MSETDVIRSMVMAFRLTELQQLLTFAGKNRNGRKAELQQRALSLVKVNTPEIRMKVRELSNAMYKSLGNGESNDRGDRSESPASDYEPTDSSEESLSPSPSPPPSRRIRNIDVPPTRRELRRSTRENSRASTAAAIAASVAAAKEKERQKAKAAERKRAAKEKAEKRQSAPPAPVPTASSVSSLKSPSIATYPPPSRSSLPILSSATGHTPTVVSPSAFAPIPVTTVPTTTPAIASHRAGYGSSGFTGAAMRFSSSASSNLATTSSIGAYPESRSSSSSSSPQILHQASAAAAMTSVPPRPQPVVNNTSSSHSSPYYYDRSTLMYPTFPDVKLKALPFFKVMATLMQPCSLQPSGTARFQEQKFSFYLSPSQANEIAQSSYRDSNGKPEYKKQILLRFSLLETSCEQDDNFPSSISVKINNKLQSLPNPIPTNKPGAEPKRPPKPINITSLCKLSATYPNYIDVSWAVDFGRGYTISVYYVDKLSAQDLLKELKLRGTRHPDYTKALIKEKLNDKDSDIATTSCKVTLACPLGKMRMSYPCRANTCDHLQCFDANLYLMMNERKPKWLCPVCNKTALFENLLLDGFFKEVLVNKRLPSDDHEIVLHNDGSWDPLPVKRDPRSAPPAPSPPPAQQNSNARAKEKIETFSVDDDDDGQRRMAKRGPSSTAAPKTQEQSAPIDFAKDKSIDCITLESSDEDDVVQPNKRSRLAEAFDDSPSPPPATASTGGSQSSHMDLMSAAQSQADRGPPADDPELICLED